MAVSRNREDYPRKHHLLIEAMGRALYAGDIDLAWEEFFRTSEKYDYLFSPSSQPPRSEARAHLVAVEPDHGDS